MAPPNCPTEATDVCRWLANSTNKGPSMSSASMARNVDAESSTNRKVGEACLEMIVCS
jgi:hypothetical protein